jgi:hypothetical protein
MSSAAYTKILNFFIICRVNFALFNLENTNKRFYILFKFNGEIYFFFRHKLRKRIPKAKTNNLSAYMSKIRPKNINNA